MSMTTEEAEQVIADLLKSVEAISEQTNTIAREYDIAVEVDMSRDTEPYWADSDSTQFGNGEWSSSGC